MSPKQQDLHLLKTLMNCNYLITVNWLSGRMREYCWCRRACIVLYIRYSDTTGCNTLVAQEYQQLSRKGFLVEFAGFICGLKAIAHTSCSLCAKLGKLTDFNTAEI